MAVATLNTVPLVRAHLVMPRVGAWTGEVELDREVTPAGPQTLVVGEVSLVGAVVRSGPWAGGTRLLLIGGAGGLAADLPAKAFRNAPFRIPVLDTLGACGEALDAASDAAALGLGFGHWVRGAGRAGAALNELASAMGVGWRFGAAGQIRFAAETWPDAGIGPFDVLHESPAHDRAELGVSSPALQPGTTLSGRRVSVAEHFVAPDRVRTVAWFES
jgi:hypothetical protein